MRLIFIAVFVALAIVIFVMGWRNQKRISWFGVFLMLLPAGGLTYLEIKWLEPQQEISLVVQELANNDEVDFQCQRISSSFFDAEASVKVIQDSPTTVKLKYAPCKALVDWYLAEPNVQAEPDEEVIAAIHQFSREIMRVSGNNNDRLIECLAVKNNAIVAQQLGASASVANYIALYYVQNMQERTYQRNPVFC